MESTNRAISLFRYIAELYAQRYRVITDVYRQQWVRVISDIKADENVTVNYMDRVEEDDESIENPVLLQLRKPDFEKAPKLPNQLIGFVKDGYDKYNHPLEIIEGIRELFLENEVKVTSFNSYKLLRDEWVLRQNSIDETRRMFDDLYLRYIELDRDSESIELMVGQGLVSCDAGNTERVLHPVLLKKVAIKFDALNNVITIVDIDSEPELYTSLLQGIDFINHAEIKRLKELLLQEYYHPLDRNETPNFLKELAHSLHSNSSYIASVGQQTAPDDRLVVYNSPMFFIRKRTAGVTKAIEDIIEQLEERGDISPPLLNLIGENVSPFEEEAQSSDINEALAAISGEDRDILLTKEANREQLLIAKRIERYNAVLVQGPPGTGKTHTIANLLGHFLSQGKNVLVTSHTKKALSVVKDKVVPELQNLCVSLIEDNNKDMERSIDGITEYLSSHSSVELAKEIETLRESRLKIMAELNEIRKSIYGIKNKEYSSFSYEGKIYSPSGAAKYVFENKEKLAYLPGRVAARKSFPLSDEDLALLYRLNELLTPHEEEELRSLLPSPDCLLKPDEFKNLVFEMERIIADTMAERVVVDLENRCAYLEEMPLVGQYDADKIEKLLSYLKQTDPNIDSLESWCSYAILDGKKAGGFKSVWETLIGRIEQCCSFAGENAVLLLGNRLEGNILKTEQTIETLSEMREYIAKGKKLNSFGFLKPKEWMQIYENVRVNGCTIETVEHCDIAAGICRLAVYRDEIAKLWFELIEKRGGLSFSQFGDEPEQVAISHVERIRNCINWYGNVYPQLDSMIDAATINRTVLKHGEVYSTPLDEINDLVDVMYISLPKYLNIAVNVYEDVAAISERLSDTAAYLNAKNSKICQNMAAAVKLKDIAAYTHDFGLLVELYKKQGYIAEKQRILSILEKFAPELSQLIAERIGVHGYSQPPAGLVDAWRWKQFNTIIEEITSLPFEELQHRSVALSLKLRKVTAKLAAKSAWYHLLCSTEKDVSQKQALQGWKLTVKKIGKGTGKTAPALRREAQRLMKKCRTAVPVWIMPINKALESIDAKTGRFDVVIIDEASQSDISALSILYLAKKIIIVGDDEQVSPSAVGVDVEKMTNLSNMFIKDLIPNYHLYDMKSSLYDIAKTTFPTLMLREHFRCVPNIIGYSNRLSYDFKIKPLRDDSKTPVKPATISLKTNGVREVDKKINVKEAKTIVALMLACMQNCEYNNMTFGAISLLGDEQAELINSLAIEKIKATDFEKRKILCGNASHFQGDERDVIFVSLVDSNEGETPLRLTGEGVNKSTKQRYNVAISRAKNQLWVVHSLDVNNDLKSTDLRRDLIEYVENPANFKEQEKKIAAKSESVFELEVAKRLVQLGYDIVQQWKVGSYRIDMVAICGDNKIAVECDGEMYHTTNDTIREDMERQAVLERLGWRFIRIRGSEYYSNPEKTIIRVSAELEKYGVKPAQHLSDNTAEQKDEIIAKAEKILAGWET